MSLIRQRKPYTPTSRFQSYIDYSKVLTTSEPCKQLLEALPRKAGRNHSGKICVRHQGGGVKRKYRIMDWKRARKSVPGTVMTVEYDPVRSAFISLVQYVDGDKSYVLATQGVTVGTPILNSENADIKLGNSLPLRKIPAGTSIHSIEMKPGAGAKIARSAGAYGVLVGKIKDYVQVKSPSGETRLINEDCYATIGMVSNPDHMNVSLGKAGRNRWMGKRPSVRGVAMNPVDHPMGGGEGKTSGGRHPCSPTGVLSKGFKTRRKKRVDKLILTSRKK